MSNISHSPNSDTPRDARLTRVQFELFLNPEGRENFSESDARYLRLWDVFQKKQWFLSWNWSAFCFGACWFVYRRMYLYAALVFGLQTGLTYFSFILLDFYGKLGDVLSSGNGFGSFLWGILPFLWVSFVWFLLLLPPIFANALYFNWMENKDRYYPKFKGGTRQALAITLWLIFKAVDVYALYLEPQSKGFLNFRGLFSELAHRQ